MTRLAEGQRLRIVEFSCGYSQVAARRRLDLIGATMYWHRRMRTRWKLRALVDLFPAVDYLAHRPVRRADKVGSMSYCWSQELAIAPARPPGVDAEQLAASGRNAGRCRTAIGTLASWCSVCTQTGSRRTSIQAIPKLVSFGLGRVIGPARVGGRRSSTIFRGSRPGLPTPGKIRVRPSVAATELPTRMVAG